MGNARLHESKNKMNHQISLLLLIDYTIEVKYMTTIKAIELVDFVVRCGGDFFVGMSHYD